jgi:hypothetical protein
MFSLHLHKSAVGFPSVQQELAIIYMYECVRGRPTQPLHHDLSGLLCFDVYLNILTRYMTHIFLLMHRMFIMGFVKSLFYSY